PSAHPPHASRMSRPLSMNVLAKMSNPCPATSIADMQMAFMKTTWLTLNPCPLRRTLPVPGSSHTRQFDPADRQGCRRKRDLPANSCIAGLFPNSPRPGESVREGSDWHATLGADLPSSPLVERSRQSRFRASCRCRRCLRPEGRPYHRGSNTIGCPRLLNHS